MFYNLSCLSLAWTSFWDPDLCILLLIWHFLWNIIEQLNFDMSKTEVSFFLESLEIAQFFLTNGTTTTKGTSE